MDMPVRILRSPDLPEESKVSGANGVETRRASLSRYGS